MLWTVIASRFKRAAIQSDNYGANCLRHSCATYLLSKGSSLKEIADFLGHRGMKSVSIYAKHDVRSLRKVAALSFDGLI
jgi:site-specific recombinase XerD